MSNLGNKETMAKNLKYYIERSGKTQKEMAEIVGVAPSTFNNWMQAVKYPRIDKIEMLANYFGILKSDLIEERTEEHREMQKKNNALADIVQAKKEWLAPHETQEDTMGIVVDYNPDNDYLQIGVLNPQDYAFPPIFNGRGCYYEVVEQKGE